MHSTLRHAAVVSLLVVALTMLRPTPAFAQQVGEADSCNQPMPDPVSHVRLGNVNGHAAYTRDGCWIIVTGPPNGADTLTVLHRNRGAIEHVRSVVTPGNLHSIALTPDDKVLLVASGSGGGAVIFLDVEKLTTGKADATLGRIRDRHFSGTDGLVLTSDGKYAFVTQLFTSWITIIDVDKARTMGFNAAAIVGGIPVGLNPAPGLLLSPDESYLYVANLELPDEKGAISCTHRQAWRPPNSRIGGFMVFDTQRAIANLPSSLVASVRVGCAPALQLSTDGDTIYAQTSDGQPLVFAYDLRPVRKGAPPIALERVPTPGPFVKIDAGRRLVAGGRQGPLRVLAAATSATGTLATLGTIAGSTPATRLWVTADGNTLMGISIDTGMLEIVDLRRLTLEPVTP